jgi:O-antigen biosynthesis protein WbqP
VKRAFDLVFSVVALVGLSPVLGVIAMAVRMDSPGPALFWSERFGAGGILFKMPKFRTMRVGAPLLATHLLHESASHMTRLGAFLRRTSLDELPQLWSVAMGDMSLVGPRPALFNQHDLMEMRREAGVDAQRPGVTGWAQINGRDELDLAGKVAYEAEYLRRRSFAFDVAIIARTVGRVFSGHGITT